MSKHDTLDSITNLSILEPNVVTLTIFKVLNPLIGEDGTNEKYMYNVVALFLIDPKEEIGFNFHMHISTFDPLEAVVIAIESLEPLVGFERINNSVIMYDSEKNVNLGVVFKIDELVDNLSDFDEDFYEVPEGVTYH